MKKNQTQSSFYFNIFFTESNKTQVFPVSIIKDFYYHEGQYLPKG